MVTEPSMTGNKTNEYSPRVPGDQRKRINNLAERELGVIGRRQKAYLSAGRNVST